MQNDDLQFQAALRRIDPDPIDVGRLIARIREGGTSGNFLRDVFFSVFRLKPFTTSLATLYELDPEAFQLFQQVLFMRYASDWSTDKAYRIERTIKEMEHFKGQS